MLVTFRADSSEQIGTGHIMRCLTLADALSERGAECQFICREHPNNLIEKIRGKGYVVHELPVRQGTTVESVSPGESPSRLAHSNWLGATQEQDRICSANILAERRTDWLVVDHYSLDACWETPLRLSCEKMMVIDDLGDRPHDCDLLLDQTYSRSLCDYRDLLLNAKTIGLMGSRFSLLRPEFSRNREKSLARREDPEMQSLLITMGGMDTYNVTGEVLQVLSDTYSMDNVQISVVMGSEAPWLDKVRSQIAHFPYAIKVLENIDNMAELMCSSDLSIGAAGGTSWERCCLGLPSIQLVLAQNQLGIANSLDKAGAAKSASIESLRPTLDLFLNNPNVKSILRKMSLSAREITDGKGVERVTKYMIAAEQ